MQNESKRKQGKATKLRSSTSRRSSCCSNFRTFAFPPPPSPLPSILLSRTTNYLGTLATTHTRNLLSTSVPAAHYCARSVIRMKINVFKSLRGGQRCAHRSESRRPNQMMQRPALHCTAPHCAPHRSCTLHARTSQGRKSSRERAKAKFNASHK